MIYLLNFGRCNCEMRVENNNCYLIYERLVQIHELNEKMRSNRIQLSAISIHLNPKQCVCVCVW